MDHIASAAMAARCGRESRGVRGGEFTSSSQRAIPASASVASSARISAGWRARASRTGGSRQQTQLITHQTPKPTARANDGRSSLRAASRSARPRRAPAWSARPGDSLPCSRDRPNQRHGAPSTMSAGPAIESRQNWTDSTTRYRRASVSTGGSTATAISASPAGASPAVAGRTSARQRGGFRVPRSSPCSISTRRTLMLSRVRMPAPAPRRPPRRILITMCCIVEGYGRNVEIVAG